VKSPSMFMAFFAILAAGMFFVSPAWGQKRAPDRTGGKTPVVQPVEANKQPGVKPRPAEAVPAETDLEEKPIGTRNDKGLPEGPTATDFLRAIAWLAVVIAMIVAVVAILKRFMPAALPVKPGSFIQVLSRTHLSPKHSIYVVKCGTELFLIGMTPTSLSCLGTLNAGEIPTEGAQEAEKGFEKAINDTLAEMNPPASGGAQAQSAEDIRRELRSIIQKVSEWRSSG